MDNNEYLQEGFNPSTLKITQLRSVLNKHNVDYSAASKKSEYVALFYEHITPNAASLLQEYEVSYVPNGDSIIDATKDGRKRRFASEPTPSSPSSGSSSSTPSSPDTRDRSPVRGAKKNPKRSNKRTERESDSDDSDNSSGDSSESSETNSSQLNNDDEVEEVEEVSFTNKNYFQTGSEKNKGFVSPKPKSPAKEESVIPSKREAPSENTPRKKKVLRKVKNYDDSETSGIATDYTPDNKKTKQKVEEEENIVFNLTPIEVRDTVLGKGTKQKLSATPSKTPTSVSSPLKFSPVNIPSTKRSATKSEPKAKVTGPKKILSFDEKTSSASPKSEKKVAKTPVVSDVVEIVDSDKEAEQKQVVEEVVEEKSPKAETKMTSKKSTFFFFIFVILYFSVWLSIPILAYSALYLRELQFNAGFCGHSTNNRPINLIESLSIDSSLPQVVPYIRQFESLLETHVEIKCLPCPDNAICRPGSKLRCESGFVKYQPWSQFTMGYLPFLDYCIPDELKEQKIETMYKYAMKQISKSRENGEASLSLDELHDILYKLKSSDTTKEEFEEQWNVLVLDLEDDDIPSVTYRADEITFDEQTPSEYLTSSDFGERKTTKIFSKYPPTTSTA